LQGNSNCGAFSSEPLNNGYSQQQVEGAVHHRSGLRIAVNPPTVFSEDAWAKTCNVVSWARNKGATVVLCMWGCNTNDSKKDGHGDGLVRDESAAREMWKRVGDTFGRDNGVFFEAFNEPFGYNNAQKYMTTMRHITQDLPPDRVVIDGLGYASDVQCIKDLWPGLLGYHIYPNWLPPGKRKQSDYSSLMQSALYGVSHRVFVTEFGANVKRHEEDYNNSQSTSHDVQFFKGVHDACAVMKPRATFVWHGWNNGDCYSFWGACPSARLKLDAIQSY
jgi:Cellulase (glycosyl hydrolase family 5)